MIKVIRYREGLNLDGTCETRIALRAVIIRSGRLLMIHSAVNGDYKFPGGGTEPGESHQQTLVREIAEECGAVCASVGALLGRAEEYDGAADPSRDYFRMTSLYYYCTIAEGGFGRQSLDDYEAALRFRPVWIEPAAAAAANRSVLEGSPDHPRWVLRETLVLEHLEAAGLPA